VVHLLDAHSFEPLLTLQANWYIIRAMAFSADGNRLAAGGSVLPADTEIRVWDARPANPAEGH
jgi:WD40 repeat protein